jgi:subfamily B ATP-binding cassette protein HlyB/CyaB
MRLAQLWTDFQQTGISVAAPGRHPQQRTELPAQQARRCPPSGRIDAGPGGVPLPAGRPGSAARRQPGHRAGEVIGIVGRSGSGKSTLTKLVQRLYVPERGRVLVDGVDLALADAAQLRRQIGVVLQENLLFNRSIRENIALADPACRWKR